MATANVFDYDGTLIAADVEVEDKGYEAIYKGNIFTFKEYIENDTAAVYYSSLDQYLIMEV